MRVRTSLILADDLMAKIDEIAGEKQRRSLVVEKALREFIAREEKKRPKLPAAETPAAPPPQVRAGSIKLPAKAALHASPKPSAAKVVARKR